MSKLEKYFESYRRNIIGQDQSFLSPYGEKKIIYADWTASGRLYKPIEKKLTTECGPFVGNTHSETSVTGSTMTRAYRTSHDIIKAHVHADADDALIYAGFGMTAAINKLQRILGLRIPEQLSSYICLPKELKPVVFLTHMEHHSNHTSWLSTIADVVVIRPDSEGLVDLDYLQRKLTKYKNRKLKIGSFTACSNVTGIQTAFHKLARIMHENNGYCFIDFAASAPYVDIAMHPADPHEKLDAIFMSPHKFLGGPGSSGIFIFDTKLYKNKIPDQPGGGTVDWTDPWGHYKFISNIELREDGGTPGFLQAIKGAMAIRLKEQMQPHKMLAREQEMLKIIFREFEKIPELHILADTIEERLGIISFYVNRIHYNLIVKLLNDRFGIQMRGGCSCAGTYGHYLLHLGPRRSRQITSKIDQGDLSEKPGWVRFSIHPTMTNDEIYYIIDAIRHVIKKISVWEKDYRYSSKKNEFHNIKFPNKDNGQINQWFAF